jgi:iron complex transport system substrate-binding protein
MIRLGLLIVVLVLSNGIHSSWADTVSSPPCARIISLAPSVTEVIFSLGLGPNVVGVTKYCRYPKEASTKPTIGGFLDINSELVFASRPSIVFALRESEATVQTLKRLGLHVVVLNHNTLAGIKKSISTVGEHCGVSEIATQLITTLNREEKEIAAKVVEGERLNALVVVGRTSEGRKTSGVYVSGKDGFYSEILNLLRIENVNDRQTVALPTISIEGISQLNPDIIVEIVNVDDEIDIHSLHEYWSQFSTIKAVKTKRIFFFSEDFASIPGPRYIHMARALAQKVYPNHFSHAASR